MVNDVGDSLGAGQRAQLLALQKTARQLDVASARLASGLKVNSAIDNPSNFFAAEFLNNRAADLTRLLDGIGQNIRAVQEADHGVQADLRLLDLAESYLKDIVDRYYAGELDGEIGLAPNETMVTFNGAGDLITYVGGQDVPASGTPVVSGSNQVTFSGNLWKRKAFSYSVTAQTVMTFEYRSTQIPEVSTIGFDNDTNFTNDNRRFWMYGTQTSGITYAAPYPTFDYRGSGAWETITIPVGTYFTGNFNYMTFVNDDDAAPLGNSAFRNIILREGPEQEKSMDLSIFREGYQRITDQIDLIARDANYRGINLLKDETMTTYFNEDNTSKLVSKGIDATVAGLGLSDEDFSSIQSVEAKIDQVKAARKVLRSFGTTLATDLNILQVRELFTQGTINTHRAGAEDLTRADLNEEGANYLALQTKQQLGVSMLALRAANVLSILS